MRSCIPRHLREYFRFAKEYYRRTGFRPNMLHVGYRIEQDDNSLFSYTYDGRVLTIDPVSTGAPGWKDFLDAYNEFCSEHDGKPLLNQSWGLKPHHMRKAFGDRIERFEEYRKRLDPNERLLNSYFRVLFRAPSVADSPAIAVSKRYFDAVRRHDLDAAVECWAPGGIDHLAPVGELRVPDEWLAYFSALFAAIPDWEHEVLNLFEEGDQVACHWRATGHFSGKPFQGLRATGAAIAAEGADLIKVENGLIKRLDSYWDESATARQIGLLPAKKSVPERALYGLFNGKTRLKSLFRS